MTKMKLWLVGLCVLFLSLPAALGLRCYDCSSTTSWDDCEARSKECLPGADRCTKDDKPNCKGQFGSFECDVNCCVGVNCNAGSTSRISGILTLTCALASLMILVKA